MANNRGKLTDLEQVSTSQEQSIIQKIKELVKTDAKVYFILWKFAPQLYLIQI